MQKFTLFKSLFISLILLSVISYFGCEKKAGESKQTEDGVKSENVSADTSSSVPSENEPAIDNKIQIPDIKGTWTGTFDGKSTTLNITEQTDSSFSGKITINYKQTLNQDVRGNFSPTALKISMADLLHSKYMGKYDGKFSADYKNFSGTFTKNRDNSKYSFNLNKK
jgi:hypothetical protein